MYKMTDNIEEDFLEVDADLPGQKFTCLSFVSPEKVLKNKQLFMVHNFLKSLSVDYKLSEDELVEKYKSFLFSKESKLEEDFHRDNDFQTTVRGVKIRGTYSSLKEAQVRASRLQKLDPNFNVYVGQVGFWLPWDPTPDNIEDQEYANKELNELIHKYNENQKSKEEHFRENIDYVREQEALKLEKKEKLIKEKQEQLIKDKNEVQIEEVTDEIKENVVNKDSVDSVVSEGKVVNNLMGETDPWLSRKEANAVSKIVGNTKSSNENVSSVVPNDVVDNTVEVASNVAVNVAVAAAASALTAVAEVALDNQPVSPLSLSA